MHRCWLAWWIVFNVVVLLSGIGSWLCLPAVPPSIADAFPLVPAGRWGRLLGLYAFSAVVSHWIIYGLITVVRRVIGVPNPFDRVHFFPPAFVGYGESVLFPTAWLLGKPEFIGLWLAIKAAVQWKLWDVGQEGRSRFNIFLVGNALSVGLGSLSFALMKVLVLS